MPAINTATNVVARRPHQGLLQHHRHRGDFNGNQARRVPVERQHDHEAGDADGDQFHHALGHLEQRAKAEDALDPAHRRQMREFRGDPLDRDRDRVLQQIGKQRAGDDNSEERHDGECDGDRHGTAGVGPALRRCIQQPFRAFQHGQHDFAEMARYRAAGQHNADQCGNVDASGGTFARDGNLATFARLLKLARRGVECPFFVLVFGHVSA